MSFWENVDDELKYKNISRKELAAKIGFAVSGISLGITNKSCPGADVACKIAKELGVTVEYLVSGDEDGCVDAQNSKTIRRLTQELRHLNSYDLETVSMLVRRCKERQQAM